MNNGISRNIEKASNGKYRSTKGRSKTKARGYRKGKKGATLRTHRQG